MAVLPPCANEKRAGSEKRLGAPCTTSAISASDCSVRGPRFSSSSNDAKSRELAFVGQQPAPRPAASGPHLPRAHRDGGAWSVCRASASVASGSSRAIASSAYCAGRGCGVHQVHDLALRCSPTIAGMRLRSEIAHRRPSASDSAAPVRLASFMPCWTTAHSPVARHHEVVQVDLEAVADRVVVHPGREAAVCAPALRHPDRAGPPRHAVRPACFASGVRGRRRHKMPSSPRPWIESAFERAHYRRGDAGRVPVHAHHACQGPGTRTGR